MSAPLSDLSRRRALAGLVTLSAATAVTVVPSAAEGAHSGDGELLRRVEAALTAHAAFEALVRRWGDKVHIPESVTVEQGRVLDQFYDLRTVAMELPAHTRAGLRAKALLVLTMLELHADGTIRPGQDDFEAWSLCRDLAGGAG